MVEVDGRANVIAFLATKIRFFGLFFENER
jgi:hypothetical protein